MANTIIPIAYVTRWSATAGIRIIRNAESKVSGALSRGFLYVAAADWTTDKAEAEKRYRAKVAAAVRTAERRLEKMRALSAAQPKYTEG